MVNVYRTAPVKNNCLSPCYYQGLLSLEGDHLVIWSINIDPQTTLICLLMLMEALQTPDSSGLILTDI